MEKIKPNKLQKNDTIGIVSVSAPEAYEQQERFEKGIDYLKQKGYNVVLSDHVLENKGYISADPKFMGEDLMKLFEDNNVNCIICAGGGSNSNLLLQYIDFEKIKENPKIFMGVSNPTTLLNAINTITGLITFHGPAIVWDFGEDNGLCKFTDAHLWPELCDGDKEHKINDESHSWLSVRDGKAEGLLVGGNLISIQALLGTKYEPDWNKKILFWEDICKPIERIDLMLTHFKDARVFEKINGMIIGQLVSCNPSDEEIYKMVLERLSEYDFPIIANVPLGHTQDKLTLPIGANIAFDTERLQTIEVKEPVVRSRTSEKRQ